MPFDTVTIGLVVGFAVGLTGMGAGTLMTPLLILVLGLRPTQAVGTALVVAALAKVVGSLTHLRQGTVDVRTVAILAAGSLPGSLAAGAVLWRLGTQPQLLEVLISRLVAVGLVLTAVALLLPARSRPGAAGRSYRGTWLAGGVAMGVLTPLTSIGAGSLTPQRHRPGPGGRPDRASTPEGRTCMPGRAGSHRTLLAPPRQVRGGPLTELSAYPAILPDQGSRTRLFAERRLREAGVNLRVTMQLPGTEAVKKAVEAGLGILKVVPLEGLRLARCMELVYRKNKIFSPVAERFREMAHVYARDHLVPPGVILRAREEVPAAVPGGDTGMLGPKASAARLAAQGS